MGKENRKANIIQGLSDTLHCSDIVFAIFTKNLNSINEIVYNFTREASLLNRVVETISGEE